MSITPSRAALRAPTFGAFFKRDTAAVAAFKNRVIAAIACVLHPEWVPTVLAHSPVLTDQLTWSLDARRHLIRTATAVNRNAIFKDMMSKLATFY